MRTYIVTDTHFNHANMVKYENRPENFNEIIIRNWNRLVKPEDLVIHLGDVIFGHTSKLEGIMATLPGTKILCLGNHDREKPGWYLSQGFAFVCDWFVLDRIAYCHYPLTPLPEGIDLCIHGHLHRGTHRGPQPVERVKRHEYYDIEYYREHQDKYKLLHIEDTLSPFLLEDVLKSLNAPKQ